MLKTKAFLTPIQVCNPADDAIDVEKWGMTAEQYLDALCDGQAVPLPPVVPGKRLTVITLAPLKMDAFRRVSHLRQETQYGDSWLFDPEIQRFVFTHSITDIDNAVIEREDDTTAPLIIYHRDGGYGRVLTPESWDHISPFLDGLGWGQMLLVVLTLTRKQSTPTVV
jgi:hypothetical protein